MYVCASRCDGHCTFTIAVVWDQCWRMSTKGAAINIITGDGDKNM